MKALAVFGMCVLAALPAWAGDGARPRLVTGSVAPLPLGFSTPETRSELFSAGGFSVGAVSNPSPSGVPVMGGFAAYSFDALRVSSSVRGDATGSTSDITASYSGALMGVDAMAALRLGYDRARPGSFSPNPLLTGTDTLRPDSDLSLSLSFTHSFNSSLSMGGFAAATRTEEDDTAVSGFRVGAGFGVKF